MTDFWSTLHQGIQKTLQREIPALLTCMPYPALRKAIEAPAVFIELDHLEPGTHPGTGEVALRAYFEARVVVDATVDGAEIAVRALASEVIRVVQHNTFGMEISPALFREARSDYFKPELDAYAVWVVEWVHEVHQGNSVWTPSGIPPHTVYAGITPEVGLKHKPKYKKLG